MEMNVEILKMPSEISNLQLPDENLLRYYKQEVERMIWIDDEVDANAIEIGKQILLWNKNDIDIPVDERKPIKILIFSPGGDLQSALGLIDIILISKTPVYTYSMGESSSAGLDILLAGHKRFALKNSTSVLHKGSAVLSGTAQQVDSSSDWYKKQLNMLRDFVLSRTNLDVKMYNKKQNDDWYLDSADLLKYGFIHEIISDIDSIIK